MDQFVSQGVFWIEDVWIGYQVVWDVQVFWCIMGVFGDDLGVKFQVVVEVYCIFCYLCMVYCVMQGLVERMEQEFVVGIGVVLFVGEEQDVVY